MSKYDFELDLSGNTSTGMILEKIENGSTVLEFGCATGRMTRYMKEAMGCRVYIVEFEEAAFQKASAYAEDGLCDDIMHYRWVERFQDVKFDAVIFADVLEHLSRPEDVLRAAAGLLKEDGAIHVSVPNITHNDILIKAFRERFDYTKVGLLDDTHIHFWGLENLKQLAEKTGLFLKSVEGTHCRTGETEQQPLLDAATARLENDLRLRPCGEAYQFVAAFYKTGEGETVYRFRQPTARMHLYLDKGNNFNQEDVLSFEAEFDGNGGYCAKYVLTEEHQAKRIRLDPVEHQSCILTKIIVSQNGQQLPFGYPQGVNLEEGVCLFGNDPMVFADLQPGETVLEVRMVLPGVEYDRILEENCKCRKDQAERLQLELLRQQAQAEIQAAQAEARRRALLMEISDWKGQFNTAKKEIAILGREMDLLRSDLAGYTTLYNRKEEYILQLEQRNRELDQINRDLDQGLRYRNTLRGLLRGLVGWTLRKAKAVAKRILRR